MTTFSRYQLADLSGPFQSYCTINAIIISIIIITDSPVTTQSITNYLRMKDEWIAVSQFNCLICFPKTFDLSNHIKSNCVQKTRFQLTVPLPSQGVMKNLPDHRMHLEIRGDLKLTLKIIAFVNMHKAKVELLARKNVFVKKTSKNGLLSVARIWVF